MTGQSQTKDRVALITGGGSGIGLATAERLLAADWKVAILDRDKGALEHARERYGDRHDRVFHAELDVTDELAAEKVIADAVTALGGLDGVVNSAGIAADIPALDTPVDLFRKVLDINVVGTFIVARAAARVMKDRGGAIVNLASIAGLRGSKGRSAYGSSKGAVCVLTQVLANDLARYGIRVNAVAPGPIDTPMVKALHSESDHELWVRFLPMRRYGTPEEVASLIEFLLDGTKSGYITGEIVAVDGGFRGAGIIADG